MTENEAIKVLEKPSKHIRMVHKTKNEMEFYTFSSDLVKAFEMAIQALEEIQQYRAIGTVEGYKRALEISKENFRVSMEYKAKVQAFEAIGTVEEIQKKMEELERWHTDRINENIKNPFAYTSTSICHNCDHKDEYIEELESEVAEYKTIGTIDEFKALKEKNVAKKPYQDKHLQHTYFCSCCGYTLAESVADDCCLEEEMAGWCPNCGHKLDWSE